MYKLNTLTSVPLSGGSSNSRTIISWLAPPCLVVLCFPQLIISSSRLANYSALTILFISIFYVILINNHINLNNYSIKLFGVYLIFLVYAGISILWAESVTLAIQSYLRMLLFGIILIISPVLLFKNPDDIEYLFQIFLFGAFLIAAVSIFGHYSPAHHHPSSILRTSNHIIGGRMIGIGVPIATFYMLYSSLRAYQILSALLIILLSLGLIVSGSRGPLIAAYSSSALIIFYRTVLDNQVGIKSLVYIVSSAVVFGLLSRTGVLYTIPTVDDVLLTLQGDVGSSAQARLDHYTQAISLWSDSPVFGSGLKTYSAIHGNYPHNFLLEIAAGMGLIGVSLILLLLIISVQSSINYLSKSDMSLVIVSIFVYSIINASLSFSFHSQRLLFLTLGVSVCIWNIHQASYRT